MKKRPIESSASDDDWQNPVFFDGREDLEDKGDPLADIYGEAPAWPSVYTTRRTERPNDWKAWISPAQIPAIFAPLERLQHIGQAGAIVTGRMPMATILRYILTITGPADVTLSTWTLNDDNVDHLIAMRKAGALQRLTLLLDPTMPRQEQQGRAFLNLLALAGRENLRLAQNHAKFAMIDGERSAIQLFTSANWNSNPRNEWSVATRDPAFREWVESAFIRPIFQPAHMLEPDPFDVEFSSALDLETDDADPFEERPRRSRQRTASTYLEKGKATADAVLPGNLSALEYVATFTSNKMHAIHVLAWALRQLGGDARITLSSWRMNRSNMEALNHLRRDGLISEIRLILDPSMRTREPEAWPTIYHSAGAENIRLQHNHAKFAILEAGARRISILSSANWNDNPRPEFCWIREDPEMHQCIQGYVDHVFRHAKTP